MHLLDQSAFILALTSFALGVSVLARNTKNKLYWSYFFFAFIISLWSLTFFLSRLPSLLTYSIALYDLHLLFHIWVTPISLFFIRTLVKEQVAAKLISLSVFFACVMSVLLAFNFDVYSKVRYAILFYPIVLTGQVFWMMLEVIRSKRNKKIIRNEVSSLSASRALSPSSKSIWIYLGALIVLFTTTMDHIPHSSRGIPVFGNLTLTIYLFFLSQAVTYQKLLNFRALVFKFFVLIFVALLVTLVYAALFAWILENPVLFFANSFFVSLMILLILDPLRTWVRFLTHRFLTHEHRKIDQRVSEGVQKVFSSFDEAELTRAVGETLSDVLESPAVEVFLISRDGLRFRNPLTTKESHVEVTHSFFGFAQRHRRPGEVAFILDKDLKNEIDRSAGRSTKSRLQPVLDELKRFNANLFIPIYSKRNPLGFIFVTVDQPPQNWGSDWGVIGLLHPLLEATAQRLLNLDYISQMRERDRLATLGQMAAGLAHEIRNPLSAIKGASQFLLGEESPGGKQQRDFLEIIESETNRLNAVVSQFLDFSKPSSDAFEKVEIISLTLKTIETFKLSAQSQDVKYIFTCSDEELEIEVVAHQIQQVLANFIQNALESFDLEQKEKSIWVTIRRRSARFVEISVKDNSTGIAPELISKLFTPFFTTKVNGTGLGLSICQRIAQDHHGRIEVFSAINEGSEFVICLPLTQSSNKSQQREVHK
jgi:two-component system sensor histidine kinase HydH